MSMATSGGLPMGLRSGSQRADSMEAIRYHHAAQQSRSTSSLGPSSRGAEASGALAPVACGRLGALAVLLPLLQQIVGEIVLVNIAHVVHRLPPDLLRYEYLHVLEPE